MKLGIIGAAALLVGSSVALAQDSDEREDEKATSAASSSRADEDEGLGEEDRGDEVVCRTERVTGSLTRRRRTCMTRDEWAALESRTRDDMIRSGSRAAGGQCIPTNPLQPSC
ncbi:hypothetical protein [Aurantiacibacter poecillastricola]|uniref:hypothetical protein n=1 Tax=Aurantiacibacter poecillastricola TaxID=3064385 RepID=UPI00273E0B81|nr:hypothetical protein [Aurantiacibacter sp. 219JJ12-13]MDP5261932.1 hypothetical protein [Aurantiacibacter sp. 219JJ12-13]